MQLDYLSDVAPHEGQEVTDQQIADILAAKPLTVNGIPKSELRAWLAETGLLRFGVSGASGWLVTLAAADPVAAVIIDWLSDALQNTDITKLRTESVEDVANGLAALQAAYANPAAPAGCPLTVDTIDAKLASWTGGARFAGITAQDVTNCRNEHDRVAARAALENAIVGAIQLRTEQADYTAMTGAEADAALKATVSGVIGA